MGESWRNPGPAGEARLQWAGAVARRHVFAILLACLASLAMGCSGPASDAEKLARVYAMYEGYRKDFAGAGEIGVAEAVRLHAEGRAVFVDARPENERAVSALPGAVSEQEFLADPGRFADKTAIGYCTISYRSGKLAEALSARGISLRNLRGGILAWTLEGNPVFGPDGRQVKAIHVYGARWDFPPAGYIAVY